MTCQWCTNFRYKDGLAVCTRPGGDGRTMSSRGGASECASFNPRVNCSTCERRCPADEKSGLIVKGRKCPKWQLRRIGKWGGSPLRAARLQSPSNEG